MEGPQTTANATQNKPRIHVLEITELLEIIIGHLPPRYILLSQRTSRHWKNVITNSISLQQALFFEPREKGETEVNPMIQFFFAEASDISFHCDDSFEIESYYGRKSELAVVPVPSGDTPTSNLFSLEMFGGRPRTYPEGAMRKEASWRRMFPVQPPAIMCGGTLIRRRKAGGNSGFSTACASWFGPSDDELLQDGGARTGLLYDVLVRQMKFGDVHLLVYDYEEMYIVRWDMFRVDSSGAAADRKTFGAAALGTLMKYSNFYGYL